MPTGSTIFGAARRQAERLRALAALMRAGGERVLLTAVARAAALVLLGTGLLLVAFAAALPEDVAFAFAFGGTVAVAAVVAAGERELAVVRVGMSEAARAAAERAAAERYMVMRQRLSHELRTPLNGIVGVAEALRDAQGSAAERRYAEEILAAADALLAVAKGATGPEREGAAASGLPPVAAAAASLGRALKVLVVEDDALSQTVAVHLLAAMGHAATAVNDGSQALAVLEREAFDLVCMDCQMPGMDGFEATRRIRQHGNLKLKLIPVVALTANTAPGDEEACYAAGMDDYLTKPVNRAQLAAVIGRWARVIASRHGDRGVV